MPGLRQLLCEHRLASPAAVLVIAPRTLAPLATQSREKPVPKCSGSEVRRRIGGSGGLGGRLVESLGGAGEDGVGERPLERGGDLFVAAAEGEQRALERVEVR